MAASLLKTAQEIDRLAQHPDWQVIAPSFPHVMTGFADRLFQESLHLNEMRQVLCGRLSTKDIAEMSLWLRRRNQIALRRVRVNKTNGVKSASIRTGRS